MSGCHATQAEYLSAHESEIENAKEYLAGIEETVRGRIRNLEALRDALEGGEAVDPVDAVRILSDAIDVIGDETEALAGAVPDFDLSNAESDVEKQALDLLERLDEMARYGFDRAGIVLFELQAHDLRLSLREAGHRC